MSETNEVKNIESTLHDLALHSHLMTVKDRAESVRMILSHDAALRAKVEELKSTNAALRKEFDEVDNENNNYRGIMDELKCFFVSNVDFDVWLKDALGGSISLSNHILPSHVLTDMLIDDPSYEDYQLDPLDMVKVMLGEAGALRKRVEELEGQLNDKETEICELGLLSASLENRLDDLTTPRPMDEAPRDEARPILIYADFLPDHGAIATAVFIRPDHMAPLAQFVGWNYFDGEKHGQTCCKYLRGFRLLPLPATGGTET